MDEDRGVAGRGNLHAGHDARPGRRAARRSHGAAVACVSEPGSPVDELLGCREGLDEKEPMVHPGTEGPVKRRAPSDGRGTRLPPQRDPPAQFEAVEPRKIPRVNLTRPANVPLPRVVDKDRVRHRTAQRRADGDLAPEDDRDRQGRCLQPLFQRLLNGSRYRCAVPDGGHAAAGVEADAAVGSDDDHARRTVGRAVNDDIAVFFRFAGPHRDAVPGTEPVVRGHSGEFPEGHLREDSAATAERHRRQRRHRERAEPAQRPDAHRRGISAAGLHSPKLPRPGLGRAPKTGPS